MHGGLGGGRSRDGFHRAPELQQLRLLGDDRVERGDRIGLHKAQVGGSLAEQVSRQRAEDNAGGCPEQQDRDGAVRVSSCCGSGHDADPPPGPLERLGSVDRDQARASRGEPGAPCAQRLPQTGVRER